MLVDMGLDEQGVLLRVQTTGDILGQLLQSAPTQISGVLTHGDGVQVCHEVVTIIFFSSGCPILNGAQIGAQGQIPAGLNTGEHDFLFRLLLHMLHNLCYFSQSAARIGHKWA